MNTIKLLETQGFTGIDDSRDIVAHLSKKHITVSYDNALTDGSRRYIFTNHKMLRSRNVRFNPINLECNGLILEAGPSGWKPLVVPLMSPKSNVNTHAMNQFLKSNVFSVYSLQDGTVINLYFSNTYSNNWVVSSARGISMNDVKFTNKTYQELVSECLLSYDLTWEQFTETLDPTHCYTLGFRHPDMHPFNEQKSHKLWTIQSVNTHETNSSVYFPVQKWAHSSLDTQTSIENPKTIGSLYEQLNSALPNFLSKSEEPVFGFMLVSSSPELTREHSVVMLESSLLRTIRRLWYDNEYVNYSKKTGFPRERVIKLNGFLDSTRHDIMLKLFPQVKEDFDSYKNNEDEMVEQIYEMLTKPSKDEDKTSKEESVELLTGQVSHMINIDLYQNPRQKIRDIIRDVKYFSMYYNFIFE